MTTKSVFEDVDLRVHTLSEQKISSESPGTILKDIRAILDFIGPKEIASGSKNGNIPSEMLEELNQKMSSPIQLSLSRVLMRNYPNIAGPYILLRVMGIVETTGKKVRINREKMTFWMNLNPVEQYFTLLEALLFFAEDSVIGKNSNARNDGEITDSIFFLKNLPDVSSKNTHEYFPVYCMNMPDWSMWLMKQFGLVEIKRSSKDIEGAPGWKIGTVKRTIWGSAVLWVILDFLEKKQLANAKQIKQTEEDGGQEDGDDSDYYCNDCIYEIKSHTGYGYFQPAFQPYFSDWKTIYAIPIVKSRPGKYLFQVTLTRSQLYSTGRKQITIPGTHCFQSLADEILKIFNIDDTEHLFRFRYQDSRGATRQYYHCESDEGPYANEVILEDSGLIEKQGIDFLFDFGDMNLFKLVLKKIES